MEALRTPGGQVAFWGGAKKLEVLANIKKKGAWNGKKKFRPGEGVVKRILKVGI